MNHSPVSLLTKEIHTESDVVQARHLARQLAARLGFEKSDLTHLGIIVSEIASMVQQNAGGGKLEFRILAEAPDQMFQICIRCAGPEVPGLADWPEGGQVSKNNPEVGILGTRQWMDHFHVVSTPGQGTTVEMGKFFPAVTPQVTPQDLADELAQWTPSAILKEIQKQDEELMLALEELKASREELTGVNRELDDTNRGVVALYAELDEKAMHLNMAKAAVAAAAQQWQTTFDAIGDGIALMEPGGKILRCNRAFTALVGKKLGEIQGQDCRELTYCTPGFIEKCLDAARLTLHRESMEVLLENGLWLNISVDPMLDENGQLSGFIHILTEITERKQAEEQLRLHASILETINDAVVVTDPSFRIKSWNQGAERIYGWKEEEVIGRPAKDVLRSELTDEQRAAIYKGLAEGAPAVTELVQYTRENRKLIVSGYTLPLKDTQGQITGYVAVNQDATERKRSEIELRTYAAQLERSNRDLQDFAYIASHDLQEPLRKVRSFSERLKENTGSRLDKKELDFIDRMQNAAERMQRMIEDLLTYSQVTTQAQPHCKVDLAQVVAEVLSDLEVRIEQSQGKIEIGNLPVIDAEPLQMRQLFQNLIGNALKFHKRNVPPIVKVQSKTLPGNRVEITVEDNGIGIAAENIDKLFQPFRRLHGRSEYEGNGIGLSICRRIVERHDGMISARSEPGEGSTFIVVLPV